MPVIINGSTGISGTDGSAATPAVQGTDTNTGMFFPAADQIAFTEGGVEAMRLDASGNVGIGTSSPGVKLDVRNLADTETSIRVSGYGFNLATLGTSGFGGTFSLARGGDGVETVRIRSNADSFFNGGNVGIGTSTPDVIRLRVKGTNTTSANYAFWAENSANTDLFSARNDGFISTGTGANSPFNLTTGSAANLVVSSGGGLARSTSSLRYKTDVQDATHGLADVLSLRPVTYKGKNDGDTVFGGLIAEEVHAAGLTEFVQYADDGTPDALAYGNMVSLCIKAIQEQQAEIEALKARVAALEPR